jgi:hypothetical protein
VQLQLLLLLLALLLVNCTYVISCQLLGLLLLLQLYALQQSHCPS